MKPDYKSLSSIIRTILTITTWHALRTHAIRQLGWEESRRTKRSISWGNYVPWLPYACTDFLHQIVSREASILELGGGGSTIWWLERGNKVVTVETSDEWAVELQQLVKEKSLGANWELKRVDEMEAAQLSKLGIGKFDVVINDGHGSRSNFVDLLEHFILQDGLIVWDNSDRDSYTNSILDLRNRGWKQLEFFGLCPVNAYCSKATVFMKKPLIPLKFENDFKTVEY